jgi:peptidyl-prolyl cis-trans isomerase A (cyclophilin A)
LLVTSCDGYTPAPQVATVPVQAPAPGAPQPAVTTAPTTEAPPHATHAAQKTAKELDPSLAHETAPNVFVARFATTKGSFAVEVHRDWAPLGADRFYNLVRLGFYDETRFFRVVSGFMVQWGIHGDPAVSSLWRTNKIDDDPVKHPNKRGTITFATSGPDSRTTQVFINFGDNDRLDAMGFAPFGVVVEGMNVVDSLFAEYGEGSPRGHGPDQGRIQGEGNEYLKRDFAQLDWVEQATLRK